MKKYLIALSLLTTLWSCHRDHEDNDDPKSTTARRTVLVYMAAENNLNFSAESDLTEMKTGSRSLAKDQNLIVYVDMATSQTTPYLARVKGGELVDTIYMEESLTADPAVLEKVLRTVRKNYPAKSYGLVLWGHASGWLISNDSVAYAQSRAYGGDTGDNSSSGAGRYWMNIPSMAEGIARGMGSDKFRYVFGDCCSFACMEVAYELRNVTDYIIGSPAEIPDAGAPYDLLISGLFADDERFHEQIVDDYYNYYLQKYKDSPGRYYNLASGDLAGYSVPLTVIKTSELENLANATAQLLTTVADRLSYPGSIDLTGVTYYAKYGNYSYSYDMQQVLKMNTIATDYENWQDTFNRACPYRLYSQRWITAYSRLASDMPDFDAEGTDCGVVSMFFPSTGYSGTIPNWNNAIQRFQWNNIIRWQQYGW